jgi:hypothetical protein
MDEMLRTGLPEIKLALGEVIDRENTRPLPAKYARLLPHTLLLVILRPDAADALRPIAGDVERELTDSCNRHGSLYDRTYRVQLQRSQDSTAPLYAVAIQPAGVGPAENAAPVAQSVPAGPPVPGGSAVSREIPLADPDATVAEPGARPGWDPDRWVLLVEGLEGDEREAFRLTEPSVTVGRGSDDPAFRPTITISDAPHVSRRQLALVWEERDGAAGFRVYNLGLNEILLPGQLVSGAHLPKGPLDLGRVGAEHTGWLPIGVPLRIGDKGPILRVDEVPPPLEDPWFDPEATVFG